jgi:tRNA (guanine37-N1)-methyltransferase
LKNIYIGLIHYPVTREGSVITSSITNLDLHDISRICATYGLGGYFVIHPDEKMRNIAQKLTSHWTTGDGKDRNNDRYNALKNLKIVPDINSALQIISEIHGEFPATVGTTAKKKEKSKPLSRLFEQKNKPVLILFGTAGGIDDNLLDSMDITLDPIVAGSGYNHLSVRSAVSIFIDRIYMYDYYC